MYSALDTALQSYHALDDEEKSIFRDLTSKQDAEKEREIFLQELLEAEKEIKEGKIQPKSLEQTLKELREL